MLKKSDEIYRKKLVGEYEKGYWSFVINLGVIQWGLPFSIMMYTFNVGFRFDLFQIILTLILGVFIGGLLFGSAMYYYTKTKLANKKHKH